MTSRLLLLLSLPALPLPGVFQGFVYNGTTGRPQPGVEVTLLKLDQGMVPVGAAKTGPDGSFRFQASLEGTHGLLRAQFQGVTYTELIPPGSRAADVKLLVYRASRNPVAPDMRVMFVEPSGGEMLVNESYVFRNESQPPVTFVGGDQGTLRFYLPPAAQGSVQVSVAGVGGVPIRAAAEKTDQPDVYRVQHPIKPGENRIDVIYKIPYRSPLEFRGRTLYPGLTTRIAAPSGVSLEGEGLQPLGQEPQSKASIFSLAGADFRLTVSGEGRLSRPSGSGDGEAGGVSIVPAAVYQQRWLIFGFAAAILGLGFYALYTASGPAGSPAAKAKKRRS